MRVKSRCDVEVVVDIDDSSVSSELSNNCALATKYSSVSSELSNNCALATKYNLFSCSLSAILFFVWIFDITNILITFNVFCSHTIVIFMTQCR